MIVEERSASKEQPVIESEPMSNSSKIGVIILGIFFAIIFFIAVYWAFFVTNHGDGHEKEKESLNAGVRIAMPLTLRSVDK